MGLKAGFGNFFIASILTVVGYVCLCFCIAEMTNILPFAGGTYGFARVTVNIYGGYIVGCCEVMAYVLYISTSVHILGKMMSLFLNLSDIYEPLYWLFFYFTAIAVQLQGGSLFWQLNKMLALISVLVIFLYFVATIPTI